MAARRLNIELIRYLIDEVGVDVSEIDEVSCEVGLDVTCFPSSSEL
jgi:hypothetical protein